MGDVTKRRKLWGWGYEDSGPSPAEASAIAQLFMDRFEVELRAGTPPRPNDLVLRRPRIAVPEILTPVLSGSDVDRAAHHYGK